MVLKRTIRARETWVKCYEELGSVSKAARKCGIPRSTLYRWIKRVELAGTDGLKGYSKRPKTLAMQKINPELVELIKSIRTEFGIMSEKPFLRQKNRFQYFSETLSGIDCEPDWF